MTLRCIVTEEGARGAMVDLFLRRVLLVRKQADYKWPISRWAFFVFGLNLAEVLSRDSRARGKVDN
jgi:hypothetical protein